MSSVTSRLSNVSRSWKGVRSQLIRRVVIQLVVAITAGWSTRAVLLCTVIAYLPIAASWANASVMQVNTGEHQRDSTAAFHRSLPDSIKHSVYRGVLAEVPELVAQSWGDPSDWAEVCGLDPESVTVTVSLDKTIRSSSRDPVFAEQYPDPGIVWYSEHGVIHGACESDAQRDMCVDSSTTVTLSLSTIRRGPSNTLDVELRLRSRSRGCPGDEGPSGFTATFLVRLGRREGRWLARNIYLVQMVT